MDRVREFAAMAGVTVRTLHHYDRLKLLCPRRTQSGYEVPALFSVGTGGAVRPRLFSFGCADEFVYRHTQTGC